MRSFGLQTITAVAMALAFLISDAAHAANQYTQRCAPDPAFVTSLYHSILKRSPDDEGNRNWVAFLGRGMKREEVVRRFFESPSTRVSAGATATTPAICISASWEGSLTVKGSGTGPVLWTGA